MSRHFRRIFPIFALLSVMGLFLATNAAVAAANLNIVYERVICDSYGNEIGYQTQTINSINELPSGSPWRSYLLQMVDSRTMLEYMTDISSSLTKPLTLKLSDRNSVSTSSKSSISYNINMYKYVTQYSSSDSRKFILLHELGHVAMLNAYPSAYNFTGLDYGDDNRHYLDEILPNVNTAWVEGWANAFGAWKNNGKVFNLSFNDSSILSFLSDNTFEEMTRNELFIAKTLYDVMTGFSSGKDKMFQTLSAGGPHYSLLDFCRSYLKLYPGDQLALAKLLDKNSHGKMSLNEMLLYVNNGSRTVSKELYAFLQQSGKLGATSSQQASSTKKSFWERIVDFFAGLFGKRQDTVAASPAAVSGQDAVTIGGVPIGTVLTSPAADDGLTPAVNDDFDGNISSGDLAQAQEQYYQAFGEYNRLLSSEKTDSPRVKEAFNTLKTAKTRLKNIRRMLPKR